MLKTTAMILEELNDYASPEDKLSRMVQDAEYIKIKNGLYESEKTIPGYLIAESIYGPSYLSFEFALSYHGLIPEAVYTFTCATFEKKKKKEYTTSIGTFTYRDVPSQAYAYEVDIVQEGAYCYKIASAEKALCDQLYKMKLVANYRELQSLLFENLRIDKEDLKKLSQENIALLSEKYKSTNVKKLCGMMGRL
jgi:predicted transcriptional regulator of viral defense system